MHTRELKELQQAHLSAEASLREELLEKWEGEKEILHQAHKQQLGTIDKLYIIIHCIINLQCMLIKISKILLELNIVIMCSAQFFLLIGDVHFQLANELDSKLGDAKLHYKKEIEILEKSAKETTDCLKKEVRVLVLYWYESVPKFIKAPRASQISNHKDSLASLDSQLADCKNYICKRKREAYLNEN